jgi:hypothetical protein
MALLDEQLVEEWLNRQSFFTMRGVKSGLSEIDLLAVRHKANEKECWHVEVQVSLRPVGYIGGDTNARKRTPEQVRAGVEQWVEKKFKSTKKAARRNSFIPNAEWCFFLVHGVLRDDNELLYMQEFGVQLIPYKRVLVELHDDKIGQSSSVASGITDLLRYMRS